MLNYKLAKLMTTCFWVFTEGGFLVSSTLKTEYLIN